MRKSTDIRKEEILRAGVTLAARDGITNVTRDGVAAFIGVVGGTVQYHFGTMGKMRSEIMRHAVKTRNAVVVAQGLAIRDKQALKADEDLQAAARASL